MRRKIIAALALLSAGVFTLGLQGTLVAQTPTKIKVAYTATADFASGFIAQEAGYFKKRGLDVEFQLIPLNSTMPAALQSGSIDLAGTTLPVFLQAVDSGLDLVAIAGSGTRLWVMPCSLMPVVHAAVLPAGRQTRHQTQLNAAEQHIIDAHHIARPVQKLSYAHEVGVLHPSWRAIRPPRQLRLGTAFVVPVVHFPLKLINEPPHGFEVIR